MEKSRAFFKNLLQNPELSAIISGHFARRWTFPQVAAGLSLWLGGEAEASGGNNKFEKENIKWQSYP
jgi:hypothetical protein